MNSETINAWLAARDLDKDGDAYMKVAWAVDEFYDLAADHPEMFLNATLEILEADASARTLGAIGAGALEEFLVQHGDKYIEQVEQTALRSPIFRGCLMFTFLDEEDVPPIVLEKIQALRRLSK